ncbi:MAG TPA: DUF4365 domain-containing protein [Ferruginibacter sp.]|jgi:hypothetical protein|nr:DUF4365 domain-containing protein [Ferruginibacter sp.]
MYNKRKNLINAPSTPYAKTAKAELDSRKIFLHLIDSQFIRGEISQNDKTPATDGILEIIDDNQRLIGKIEIQLKTLNPKSYKSLSFQCKDSFLASCENATLPVILIVVNRTEQKVYWRHIDSDTLVEVSKKLVGKKSCTIKISPENSIGNGNTNYITQWGQKAKDTRDKVWNFDILEKQYFEIEKELELVNSKLKKPISLSVESLREINEFIDCYNDILNREFRSIKEIIYPNYWKIGIGIISYQIYNVVFILFPIKYTDDQILIKEIQGEDLPLLEEGFSQGTVLLRSFMKSKDKIKDTPSQYAYELLESNILRIAGKQNLPIPDEFIAHEYLVSFIDKNAGYLDMDSQLDSYLLNELKDKICSILPMVGATSHGYADWVTEHDDDIDGYSHWKYPSSYHQKHIADCIIKINEGFVPKVKVRITSQLYNIDLINYYINFLENKGITETKRQYKKNQINRLIGSLTWNGFTKEALWNNIKLVFQDFNHLYNLYLKTHFKHIEHTLKLSSINEHTTIIYVFYFNETHRHPQLSAYRLNPKILEKGEIIYLLAEDPNNPIDSKKFAISDYKCFYNNKEYEIVHIKNIPLEFLFTFSPTYSLINEKLTEKLRGFFKEKKSSAS